MASQATSTTFPLPAAADRDAARTRELLLQAGIFLAAFLVLFIRRPDALLNAQFYAEDGKYWYAEAYNYGWRCLLVPVGGYLNTLSRLIGLTSLLFPMLRAPLFMNLCALAVGALPVNVFLSSRFSEIPLKTRVFGCALYLALPNAFEIHANTTNIQWHLALVGLLLLLGKQDDRLGWRVFDAVVYMLVVLDGPLGILLIPIAAILRWVRKDARFNLALLALIPPACLQVAFMFMSDSRRTAENGASLRLFTSIVGGQVFLSPVMGVRTAMHMYFEEGENRLFVGALIALIFGVFFVFYALRKGPLELKLFYLFAAMLLGLAMKHPLASFAGTLKQWELMEIPGCGNRYYYFPMLAFLATPIWMLSYQVAKSRFSRCAALIVLLLLPIGICRDWQYKPFPDKEFKSYVTQFEQLPPGARFTIPIHPMWEMNLVKH